MDLSETEVEINDGIMESTGLSGLDAARERTGSEPEAMIQPGTELNQSGKANSDQEPRQQSTRRVLNRVRDSANDDTDVQRMERQLTEMCEANLLMQQQMEALLQRLDRPE